jgi:hypothetical protein
MKTLQNLIVLCFIATTFACGDKDDGCGERKDRYYYLSADAKSKIPYTGTDTLVFVSNTGDTARCIGQGTQVSYESVLSAGPCPGSQEYEVNSTSYVGDLNIEISLRVNRNRIVITMQDSEHSIGFSQVGDLRVYSYMPSITIDSVTYMHVHELDNNLQLFRKIIFNQQYGIIQINHLNNKIWNRL